MPEISENLNIKFIEELIKSPETFKSYAGKIVSSIENIQAFEGYVAWETFYHEKFEGFYRILLHEASEQGEEAVIRMLTSNLGDTDATSFKAHLLKTYLEEIGQTNELVRYITALCQAMVSQHKLDGIIFIHDLLNLEQIELLLATHNPVVYENIYQDYVIQYLINKYDTNFVDVVMGYLNFGIMTNYSRGTNEPTISLILNFLPENKRKKYIEIFFLKSLKPDFKLISLATFLWDKYDLKDKNKRFDWIVDLLGLKIDYDTYFLISEAFSGIQKNIPYPFPGDRKKIILKGESLKEVLPQVLDQDFEDLIQLNARGRLILESLTDFQPEDEEGVGPNYIELLLMYTSKKLRFDKSEWASGTISELVEILSIYRDNFKMSAVAYSTKVEVKRSKGQILDMHKVEPESIDSYYEVTDILREAVEFIWKSKVGSSELLEFKEGEEDRLFHLTGILKNFFTDLKVITNLEVKELFAKYHEFTPELNPQLSLPKLILFILQLRLEKILTDKETYDLITKYLFVLTLIFNPEQMSTAEMFVKESKFNYRNVSWLINFVQHIALEETGRYLRSEFDAQDYILEQLKKIIPLGNINKALYAAIDLETENRVDIKFDIRRDLISEFSGQISDACWAGRENESILFDYTNIDTLIISRGKNLIGSCLLIKSIDKNGNPVLIMRGINPRESEVNKISVAQLISSLLETLREYAKKLNRKPLVVIDDHVGGASTNRPRVFGYLTSQLSDFKKFEDLEDITDKANNPTVYNGYYISENVYEI